MPRVLSLGAGVQSSTLALMASEGEVGPAPDCAIFADTQSEPAWVYRHLDWLDSVLPFPIYRVTAGSLRGEILKATKGEQRADARPPFFVEHGGMLRRQCTQDYKLIPIHRKVRELLGLRKHQRGPTHIAVEQWIGISIDEASRMKPSRYPWILHRWPLVEREMSRQACIQWLVDHNFPVPNRSACTFCPYHDDRTWQHMRENDPASFADAVLIDRAIRNGVMKQRTGKPLSSARWYVHRSLIPLDQVAFNDERTAQLNLFENECEGVCGI